ncbi:MAG: oxidoreductase [Ignavibacteriae bacterium]|nr:MAG: oxidoreductase [Ignavibacteriota bacterium]
MNKTAQKIRKPKLAVWKFSSCDGCQLSLLDCEEELLPITEYIEIANFPEASRASSKGPYDISLVEGSITTPHDAERIHQVRRQSKVLMTIGACATAGGIQALRNFKDVKQFISAVYANAKYIETLNKSTPIADHVFVDFELRGCPINKLQLLEVINAFLNGRKPNTPASAVCLECKRRFITCELVTHGALCLGPVTQAGCDALCPSYARGCFGCFGPKETPNTSSLSTYWNSLGIKDDELVRLFRGFNAYAEAFRRESEAHEK